MKKVVNLSLTPQGFIPTFHQDIRACIVDLDGTLIDTLGDFEVALNSMLAELKRPPVSAADIGRWVGKGSEHLIKTVLESSTSGANILDSAAVEELMPAAWRHYQASYLRINGQHSTVFPGAQEGLAALKARGYPLACLTNKPRDFAIPLLEAKGLSGYFSYVFGGDSFARKKPDPLPLIETCKALAVAPHQTLMIGDSANDAQAARAAGCPVVLTTYGYNHGEPIQAVDADGFVNSLADIVAWLDAK
ncbi:phosphoglycolate phosphatase [Ottowia thiooxydans]|uniref:phosphoglycolate phosphatase n=1 Tax=Ottowia thiooxydans TaxID=219182 RepID=UPI0004044327|nr:phosphoglycolate phosphatase [Ottowia thiooxydans]